MPHLLDALSPGSRPRERQAGYLFFEIRDQSSATSCSGWPAHSAMASPMTSANSFSSMSLCQAIRTMSAASPNNVYLAVTEPVGEEGHGGIAVDRSAVEVEEGAIGLFGLAPIAATASDGWAAATALRVISVIRSHSNGEPLQTRSCIDSPD